MLRLADAPAGEGTDGTPRDNYTGRSQPTPQGRVFGGQVVAQSLIAAGRSMAAVRADEMHVHSLHVDFLQPGDPERPLRFTVERLRDSRSFSTRRVHVMQGEVTILAAMASFAAPAEGMDHQEEAPKAPGPEGMSSLAEDLYPMPATEPGDWVLRRAVEIRHVQGHIALQPGAEQHHQEVWMKALGALPDEPLLHAAILGYASDWVMMDPVLRRHGVTWTDPRLRVASLDHSMWFHRPIRADEWVLFTQFSPSAAGGRGLSMGHMYAPGGTLGVTIAQEGMVRLKN